MDGMGCPFLAVYAEECDGGDDADLDEEDPALGVGHSAFPMRTPAIIRQTTMTMTATVGI
jgi:hypothetical protein